MYADQVLQLILAFFIAPALHCHLKPVARSETLQELAERRLKHRMQIQLRSTATDTIAGKLVSKGLNQRVDLCRRGVNAREACHSSSIRVGRRERGGGGRRGVANGQYTAEVSPVHDCSSMCACVVLIWGHSPARVKQVY